MKVPRFRLRMLKPLEDLAKPDPRYLAGTPLIQ